MKISDCKDIFGEIFTHFDDKTGEQTDIAVTELERHYVKNTHLLKSAEIAVTNEDAALITQKRGIEQHRLNRLLVAPLPFVPITICEWRGGTHLIVNGSHRYVASWIRNQPGIRAIFVPETMWRQFVLEDLPKENPVELVNSFSGIL